MTAKTNTENLRQYKTRFCLIVEQTLAFDSSTDSEREVKNVFPDFRQIAYYKL